MVFFKSRFLCYPLTKLPGRDRPEVENGGKIILPQSTLEKLLKMKAAFPMTFKITNMKQMAQTHVGVLEFIAEEGRAYLPQWMMQRLQLKEGTFATIQQVLLPVATFAKMQAQSVDFLKISNPKAMLENRLRNFTCITTGDIVLLNYNNKIYKLCMLETKPGPAVMIIDCDMEVEFVAPIGYVEPELVAAVEETMEVDHSDIADCGDKTFYAFKGQGKRLNGQPVDLDEPRAKIPRKHGIPDLDHNVFKLTFDRSFRAANDSVEQAEPNLFELYQGQGRVLVDKKD